MMFLLDKKTRTLYPVVKMVQFNQSSVDVFYEKVEPPSMKAEMDAITIYPNQYQLDQITQDPSIIHDRNTFEDQFYKLEV